MFVPTVLSCISPALPCGLSVWATQNGRAAGAPAKGEREVNTPAVLHRGLPEIQRGSPRA